MNLLSCLGCRYFCFGKGRLAAVTVILLIIYRCFIKICPVLRYYAYRLTGLKSRANGKIWNKILSNKLVLRVCFGNDFHLLLHKTLARYLQNSMIWSQLCVFKDCLALSAILNRIDTQISYTVPSVRFIKLCTEMFC